MQINDTAKTLLTYILHLISMIHNNTKCTVKLFLIRICKKKLKKQHINEWSEGPTVPIMHPARLVSGPAPFLERIGTRSQDSINEGSFAEKVTCFPTDVRRFSTKWRRSFVAGVQTFRPVRREVPYTACAAACMALLNIDSGLGVCVSGPSAIPTVLCYILVNRSRADRS